MPAMKKPQEARFGFLLVALLLILVVWPIAYEALGDVDGLIVQIAFTLVLIIGIWSLETSRGWFVSGILLTCTSIGLTIANAFLRLESLEFATIAVLVTFCALSAMFALRQIFETYQISLNQLAGAVCVYLLFGFMFGLIYALVDRFFPGSFVGIERSGSSGDAISFIYYSFVTLTTLGYGDVVPIRPVARTFAYIEAVAGIFYIAILVGALVGLLLSRESQQNEPPNA